VFLASVSFETLQVADLSLPDSAFAHGWARSLGAAKASLGLQLLRSQIPIYSFAALTQLDELNSGKFILALSQVANFKRGQLLSEMGSAL